MTIDVHQTRLPGIGSRYSFTSIRGTRLTVIRHNDGLSEIYVFARPHPEKPQAIVQLEDDESRQLGAILGGAYDRPKIIEDLELALGELAIEWIPVPPESPAIGHTLAECGLRARTGITIIAILREPQPIAGAQPYHMIEQDDTLVTVGTLGQYPAFRRLLAEGPFPAPTATAQTGE
jgi:TrkA domain protein